jgi:hypothetical protein
MCGAGALRLPPNRKAEKMMTTRTMCRVSFSAPVGCWAYFEAESEEAASAALLSGAEPVDWGIDDYHDLRDLVRGASMNVSDEAFRAALARFDRARTAWLLAGDEFEAALQELRTLDPHGLRQLAELDDKP